VFVLLELLFVKVGYFTVSHISHDDITHSIDLTIFVPRDDESLL